MRRLGLFSIAIVLAAMLAGGCAGRRGQCVDCLWPGGMYDQTTNIPLRLVGREDVEVDATAAATLVSVDEVLGRATAPEHYQAMTADEVKCRAASASTVGALIDMERQVTIPSGGHAAAEAANQVRLDLLAMRSADERNRAAGKALELFYQLVEAEAGRDALKRSLEHAEQSIANLRELKERGLAVDVDDSELETQKSDLLTRQTELELSIEKLNGGLQLLLGNESNGQPPIWPEADLTVTAESIDADEAVAVGLGTRADLAMLRYLLATLDEDTLPTVRSSLRQQEFSLGNPPAPMRGLLRIFKRDDTSSDLEVRRYQLMRLTADQERAASEEIRSAVATVNTRVRQVAVANQSLVARRQRLEDVQAKRRIGRGTALDVSKAQADVIEAEYTLVQQAVAWRLALAKLHEAQGMLAVECGYGPTGHNGSGFFCPECLASQQGIEFVQRPIRTYPKRATAISTRNSSPSVSLNEDASGGEILRTWHSIQQSNSAH